MDALISNVRKIHPRSFVSFKTGQNFHYELKLKKKKKGKSSSGVINSKRFFLLTL